MKTLMLSLGCLALECSAQAADNPKPTEAAKPLKLSKQARQIVFHVGAVEEIYCHVNDETMIRLPEGEEALVVQGGDAAPKGTWLYQTAANGPARRYVGVKPSLAGTSTTLHIVTNHNVPYAFIVREVTNTVLTADVAVDVVAGDDLEAKVSQPPVLVTADEANRYKQEAADAVAKLAAQRKEAEADAVAQISLDRTRYSKLLNHNYRFDRLKAPFYVTDVATDGTFTFVYVDPKHTKAGAIYTEVGKKNKANLPNWDFDAEKGVYTIQGIVEHGYLAFKDDRVDFARLAGDK